MTCTIGELAAEDGVTITLATPVNAEMPGRARQPGGSGDYRQHPNTDNDSSEASVTVLERGDLSRDGVIDTLDVPALVQEIDDGDGENVA